MEQKRVLHKLQPVAGSRGESADAAARVCATRLCYKAVRQAVRQAGENDTAISAMLNQGYPEMRRRYNEYPDTSGRTAS
jgi:hypothetical protein